MEAQTAKRSGKRVSMCVGCGSQILDQYILKVAPDLDWHAGCLKCADCESYLDESCTCFVRDGKTYCKRDYHRLFGVKCALCDKLFFKKDYIMRARDKIYHVDCFRCAECHNLLCTGDEFAIHEDGRVFCKDDLESAYQADRGSTPGGYQDMVGSPGSGFSSSSNTVNNNNNSTTPNNNSNSNSSVSPNGNSGDKKESDGKRSSGGGPGKRSQHKGDHKTTRVRTVLNEKQLHTLRTCYNANPRPDALMKEQLTEMTGLSPRVIRVWFQNKRCKDKKRSLLLKQMQAQQEKSGQLQRPLNGVPMVASSPVRHEGPPGLQANPVEVQSYQTPWKALSEFAMQGEMDHQHPPFQQLMSSFEHMDHGCHGSPPHSDIMMQGGYHHIPHDDMPNSVGSDFPGTPSELSSPLSQ